MALTIAAMIIRSNDILNSMSGWSTFTATAAPSCSTPYSLLDLSCLHVLHTLWTWEIAPEAMHCFVRDVKISVIDDTPNSRLMVVTVHAKE